MEYTCKYLEESRRLTVEANKIIRELRIREIWEESGAEVNQVGSLRMGLLGKNRDMDFHVYTDILNVERSFSVVGK